jgi:metal-dependent hydrolase (beta-lactamase superfamily II)
VVFSACSHAGIINVVKAATQAAGRPPCCIMGGEVLCLRWCLRIEWEVEVK